MPGEPLFEPQRVIGLMSGTSMDGIDAAFVETDGEDWVSLGPFRSQPYEPAFRQRLGQFIEAAPERDSSPEVVALERELTDLHKQAIESLLSSMDRPIADIDLIGFHGQTIWHRPEEKQTWQMGDGVQLAKALSTPVVFDFRQKDVESGGEGAPLAPVFHGLLARKTELPTAIVNIGGVANITWIGPHQELLAFDTGPGCGLIDDWVNDLCGLSMDRDGAIAARGSSRPDIVKDIISNPYFDKVPPKSLDRFNFEIGAISSLGVEDGAATLVALTAECIYLALQHCPQRPRSIFVTGGGRRNPTLMAAIERRVELLVRPVEEMGWDGDAIEAQAFAYMAVRGVRQLPITFPGTTGVHSPMSGGRLVEP